MDVVHGRTAARSRRRPAPEALELLAAIDAIERRALAIGSPRTPADRELLAACRRQAALLRARLSACRSDSAEIRAAAGDAWQDTPRGPRPLLREALEIRAQSAPLEGRAASGGAEAAPVDSPPREL